MEQFTRKGLRWTEDEDKQCMESALNHVPLGDIAATHQRSVWAIKLRIMSYGLQMMKDDPNATFDEISVRLNIPVNDLIDHKRRREEKLNTCVNKKNNTRIRKMLHNSETTLDVPIAVLESAIDEEKANLLSKIDELYTKLSPIRGTTKDEFRKMYNIPGSAYVFAPNETIDPNIVPTRETDITEVYHNGGKWRIMFQLGHGKQHMCNFCTNWEAYTPRKLGVPFIFHVCRECGSKVSHIVEASRSKDNTMLEHAIKMTGMHDAQKAKTRCYRLLQNDD